MFFSSTDIKNTFIADFFSQSKMKKKNRKLLKINNKPMIIHVIERARESNVGEVVVATPDDEIAEIVTKNSCRAIITSKSHNTGTDRIHEALQKLYQRTSNFGPISFNKKMFNLRPWTNTLKYSSSFRNFGSI